MTLPPHLIVSTDFDGTLTSPGEPDILAPEFMHWLETARKKSKVTWIINTGRCWKSLSEELTRRQAEIWPDWVVLVEREIFRVRGKTTSPLSSWNDHCTEAHSKLFKNTDALWEQMRFEFREVENLQLVRDIGCPLGLIAHTAEQADELEDKVLKLISNHPDLILTRNSIYFRFAHRSYTKGSCLCEIAREEKMGPEASFVAGDHLNDLPMMNRSSAHFICCPANSAERVKIQVRSEQGYVSLLPESRGVVDGLNHYFG